MNIQLFLNDKPVDLSDDSPIALTFQINDLAEVQNQQGNTSNQFKLPLTQNNRAILGYADDISIENPRLSPQIPYTQLTAKVIQNGIEILPNAIAEINQIDDNTASITILSGNVDFFDALGGQIADMGDSTSQWSGYGAVLPWKPFDHIWNVQNVAGSQKNTAEDGWIYPVVDYGLIDLTDFTLPINARNQRPGFFIKKAIDLLVQSTGYTAKGSLLADPLYPLLIAQFSNGSWEHGLDYQNQPDVNGIMATNAIAQTQQHPAGNTGNAQYPNRGAISFNSIIYDPSSLFKNNVYMANEIITVDAILTIPSLYFYGRGTTSSPSNLNINITLLDSGLQTDLISTNFNFDTGFDGHSGDGSTKICWKTFTNVSISFSTQLTPATAEGLLITFEFLGLTGANFTLYEGATLQVKAQNENVLYGQTVQCERILPDISQKDFLKDTLQRFGIICQTDVYTKSITFASIKDIVNNIPIANDWSTKCIDQGKQVNFQLGNYAQVNYMEYQTDPNILPLKFGWDQMIINDQTLSSIPADLIVSRFGPSLNRPYYGGTIAQIKMADITSTSTDFTIGVQPRLLVDQKLNLQQLGKTVTFTDGNNTNIVVNDVISTPYFYKPDGEYNLCWCDMTVNNNTQPGLRSKYYTDLQKILQNTKVLVRYFLLSPRDISELDLLIPIYLQQHNAYFYINKIDSWIKDKPTKVELVRLG